MDTVIGVALGIGVGQRRELGTILARRLASALSTADYYALGRCGTQHLRGMPLVTTHWA